MIRKYLAGLIILIVCAGSVNAQKSEGNASVTGKVTDSVSGMPLEYATISVFKKGEKKPFTGTTTDKSGTFTLSDLPDGTFNIVFEFIGYIPNSKNDVLINSKNSSLSLKVGLSRKKGELQGVTVIAQGKLVENKIDKLVFNAEKEPNITNGSGYRCFEESANDLC